MTEGELEPGCEDFCDGCRSRHQEEGGGDGWFWVCDDADDCEQMKEAKAE